MFEQMKPWKYGVLGWMLILFFVIGLPLGASGADAEITARYSQPRGTSIKWSITIPNPPPAAVIVIQMIPPGTDILSATPAYSSFDKKTGTAKWLLSGVYPGKVVMKMKLSKPIRKKGEIHGKIMFQDQSAKSTASTSMVLTPKAKKKAIEGC